MPSNQADFLYLNIMENYSLVTGASSGIGLEICKYLASSTGWKVWRREKGVSHNWSPETTFKYMLVQRRLPKRSRYISFYAESKKSI